MMVLRHLVWGFNPVHYFYANKAGAECNVLLLIYALPRHALCVEIVTLNGIEPYSFRGLAGCSPRELWSHNLPGSHRREA